MAGFTPKVYAQLTGVVVGIVAVLGFLLTWTNNADLLGSWLVFDNTHNIAHVVLAAVALYVGFGGASASLQKNYAIVFGAVYALLGIAGFFTASILGIGLEVGENLIHLVVGALGLYAGTMGAEATSGTRT